jgi:hypothetical protein
MVLNKFQVLSRHLPVAADETREISFTIADLSSRSLKPDAAKYDTDMLPTEPLISEVTLLLLYRVTTRFLSETHIGKFLSSSFP